MDQPPDEVLVLIFRNFTVQELCHLLSVCRDWKEVLESKVLWKNLELERHVFTNVEDQKANDLSDIKLLEIVTDRSGQTLETFSNLNILSENRPFAFTALLELSKSTLRRIDLPLRGDFVDEKWMESGNFLLFFKRFVKLERLNLEGGFLPDIEPAEKGKLTSLSLRYDDPQQLDQQLIVSSKEDQEWLSHLKVLHFTCYQPTNAVPDNLIAMLEACKQNLTELKTSCFDKGNAGRRIKGLELPDLETLTVVEELVENGAYDFIKAPKLKELNTNLVNVNKLPYRRLSSLGFIITYRGYVKPEEHCRMMVEGMQLNASSLRELQIYPEVYVCLVSFDLDPLLLRLKATSTQDVLCPNLSSMLINEESPDSHQRGRSYDEHLLAEMLLSRRLAARSSNSTQEKGIICSEITLYIPADGISTFRIAEEEILAGLSKGEREMVGKAQVKTLQEIEKSTYWELCSSGIR